jgi:hypothetical protein
MPIGKWEEIYRRGGLFPKIPKNQGPFGRKCVSSNTVKNVAG